MSDSNDKQNSTRFCVMKILNIISITLIIALTFMGIKCIMDNSNVQLGGDNITLGALLNDTVSEFTVGAPGAL